MGSCVLIGQPLNFANIIALPLLFGIGVAFHIYFVMAWRAGAEHLLNSSLARAVFFSALATATGFGSLWASSHPGTASMGKLSMISLVWTLVSALLFQPALMGSRRAHVWRHRLFLFSRGRRSTNRDAQRGLMRLRRQAEPAKSALRVVSWLIEP